jgi:hypothetical protein
MHLLRHPRNAALLGVIFIVIAFIFWVIPSVVDPALTKYYNDVAAGTTMLVFLGVAMALMAYVLVAASSDD